MQIGARGQVKQQAEPDPVLDNPVVLYFYVLLQQLHAGHAAQRALCPLDDMACRRLETIGGGTNQLANLRDRHSGPSLVPASRGSYLPKPCPPRDSEAAIRTLDPLVFSSLWAAAVAPALMLATAASAGLDASPYALVVGFTGTLIVYGVDRLRDLDRDTETRPVRSAYIAQHWESLRWLYTLSLPLGALAMVRLPATAWIPVGVAGGLGLLHRRLKGRPVLERAYVTLAWVAVCVGLPVASAGAATASAGPPAVVLSLVIAGNLIATQAQGRGVVASASLCLGGLAAAWTLPGARDLWPVAALEAVAVLGSAAKPKDPERYALVVVDGALTVGAALCVGLA